MSAALGVPWESSGPCGFVLRVGDRLRAFVWPGPFNRWRWVVMLDKRIAQWHEWTAESVHPQTRVCTGETLTGSEARLHAGDAAAMVSRSLGVGGAPVGVTT